MAERDVNWWKDEIRAGLRFQVKYGGSNLWPQYKKYYRHFFPKGILPVNLVFSVLRSIVPQVYFRDPRVTVTPQRPGLEYELHAKLVESIDNWLLRELFVKNEFKKMITDAFLCGTASGFVGYDSEYGFSDKHLLGGDSAATLTQFDNKGYRIEYNAFINPGMPWFLRARPEDVIYPWGCESANNAEWVAMRVFRNVEDIKKDPKYKNTKDLNGSYTQQRTQDGGAKTSREDLENYASSRQWVELWQVHDLKTKKIFALTMDHPDFLREDEDLIQIEGLPVETLVFNPDPDYIYGIPDTKIIEPQMLELNEIRTQAMKHRRVDILKLLVKKGVVEKDELDKLLSEEVKGAIQVDTEGSVRDAIMPLTPGATSILNDLIQAGEVVRGDVRETVGFSRVASGEYQGKTHVTKAETDIVQWAKEIRLDERRDMAADILTNVIRKFNQLIFTHWKTPMVRSIVGPDGAKWWLQFSGSEIKGEFNYKVDPSNNLPVDQRTKRQDAIDMAKAWAEMNQGQVQQGMPVPAEIQRYFFSQFEGINVDKLLAEQGAGGMGPGPGMNPGMPLPPQIVAQLMAQKKGGVGSAPPMMGGPGA